MVSSSLTRHVRRSLLCGGYQVAARSLDERVEILGQKVEGLQKLPARMDAVESQILQLRDEMRVEFSAIRKRFEETKQLAQELHQEVLTRLHEGDQENG